MGAVSEPLTIALFAVLLVLAALGAAWLLGRALSSESFRRAVLVLGAGPRAARIEAVAQQPGAYFRVVRFIAMTDGPVAVLESARRPEINDLTGYARDLGAREVVVALDERRGALPLADLMAFKAEGLQVHDFSAFLERETGRVDLATFSPSWLVFADEISIGRQLARMAKRLFDIVFALAALALAAPFILIGALLVVLESRGPAFVRQRRIGLYGTLFDVVQIRITRSDPGGAGVAVWSPREDPRLTRVGAVLRRLGIDALPQLVAVLQGHLSFVGPHAERPQFVADLEARLPHYAERHMVKPGLAGWAQVHRTEAASVDGARRRLEYDLYYAKHQGPMLDVVTLLLTLRAILWPVAAR